MHPLNTDNANLVYNALVGAKFPASSLPFVMSQVAYETTDSTTHTGFSSFESMTDNNFSGIKYNAVANGDIATMGNQSPEGNHYAHYNSVNDWAQDLKRILSLNRGAGRPIDATSLEDYVHRLHSNGYFTDHEPTYLAGVSSLYNSISIQNPGLFVISTLSQTGDDLLATLMPPSDADVSNANPAPDSPASNFGTLTVVAGILLTGIISYFLLT